MEIRKVDKSMVARFLGIKDGKPDAVTEKLIDRAEELIRADTAVSYTYKLYDFEIVDEGVKLVGAGLLLPGEDLKELLKDSVKCIVMCSTIGGEVDTRTRMLSVKEPALAVVYDAVAGCVADALCDDIENEIKKRLPEMEHTFRFSPGYGDLPLGINEEFLSVINGQKLTGIKITEGGLMTPIKSVSAIFGLVPKKSKPDTEDEKSKAGPEACSRQRKSKRCGEPEYCEKCALKSGCKISPLNNQ